MPEAEVLTAIFPHPEEPCQPNESQTEREVEELPRKHCGKGIPHFAVKTDCLYHLGFLEAGRFSADSRIPSKWTPVVASAASRLNTTLAVSMPYGERSIRKA